MNMWNFMNAGHLEIVIFGSEYLGKKNIFLKMKLKMEV